MKSLFMLISPKNVLKETTILIIHYYFSKDKYLINENNDKISFNIPLFNTRIPYFLKTAKLNNLHFPYNIWGYNLMSIDLGVNPIELSRTYV